MTRRLGTFWIKAMIGYGVVVLLLAGGMMLTTHRFDSIATGHVNRIRTEENQITYAERLRWSGEAIVSTGRGYLISGDSSFLTRLERARASFEHGIRALTEGASDDKTRQLVADVEDEARAFSEHQRVLVATMISDDVRALARRFDTELVPLQLKLGASLDRLIDYKETAIDHVYARVSAERVRLRHRVRALLGILVLASLAVAGYVANALGRSYRKEREALEVSRKALAARDEIMGVVAHDLRNPLSSIAMRAALLLEETDGAAIRKHAAGIERVTSRMEGLIKTMLDVATIESGHFTVDPASYTVESLCDAITEMFASLAAQKQIRLERVPVPANLAVHVDRDRVLQVLQNLVGNALKFTPPGGQIVIAAEPDGGMVKFRISDTGPGIASEHLSRLFERFWKNETAGKKGTGLGLFIAKGIVEAHGGRIWAEAGPTPGASFYFTLPMSAERAASPAPVASIPVSARALHRV
jgi:signal transduction histidine kinase